MSQNRIRIETLKGKLKKIEKLNKELSQYNASFSPGLREMEQVYSTLKELTEGMIELLKQVSHSTPDEDPV